MKTLEGIYENGRVRLIEDADIPENQTVYIFVPEFPRKTGIQPERNKSINDAKRKARTKSRDKTKLRSQG